MDPPAGFFFSGKNIFTFTISYVMMYLVKDGILIKICQNRQVSRVFFDGIPDFTVFDQLPTLITARLVKRSG